MIRVFHPTSTGLHPTSMYMGFLKGIFSLSILILLNSCDVIVEPIPTLPESEFSIRVIDQDTYVTVDSALVKISLIKTNGDSSTEEQRTGYTSNGVFSCSIPEGYTIYFVTVEKYPYALWIDEAYDYDKVNRLTVKMSN